MINPLIIDEVSGETKRKQPPMVFRSGIREVHNKLEKHRRAHLKECFDMLKKQLPVSADEKKTSNLSILHAALRHIQSLKVGDFRPKYYLAQNFNLFCFFFFKSKLMQM